MTGRHIFIPLQAGIANHYASCNILNDDSLLYVYLLHPERGSMLFTLMFDETAMQYKPRHIVPGLDGKTIELINEKIHEDILIDTSLYENNYRFVETGAGYGYLVINRLFVKVENSIAPTEKFHVFQEGWEQLNEYEWDGLKGLVALKGQMPDQHISKLINQTIGDMNTD